MALLVNRGDMQPASAVPFEQQARSVLQSLRTALAGMINALPGPPQRAADLERALGINTKLAWQIHRVATSANPLAEVEHVPGNVGMKQVLRRAASLDIGEDHLRRISEAMETFEQLVRAHAGDRSLFTSIANSIVNPAHELLDMRLRRDTFRNNSVLWGVQVKKTLITGMYFPGSRSNWMDCITIRGGIDLLRFRPDVPMVLTKHWYMQGAAEMESNITPLKLGGGDGQIDQSELLSDYCSQPLPAFTHRREGKQLVTEIDGQPIGRSGAFTYFIADVARNLDWTEPEPEPDERRMNQSQAIGKPMELLSIDVLIYDGMFGRLTPRAGAYADLTKAAQSWPVTERDRLPMDVNVERLGSGTAAMHLPDYPRYVEMLESVCSRMGLDPERFEVFRCRVEYPVLHSLISVRFPLPDKGNW